MPNTLPKSTILNMLTYYMFDIKTGTHTFIKFYKPSERQTRLFGLSFVFSFARNVPLSGDYYGKINENYSNFPKISEKLNSLLIFRKCLSCLSMLGSAYNRLI